MRKYKAGLWILFGLLISLAGCGGGANQDYSRAVTTTGQYKSLQFTATGRVRYHRGESIPITFTVKNVGTEPVSYDYGGCVEYGEIFKQGERVVAYITAPFGCTGIVRSAVFEPGELHTFSLEWDQLRQDGSQQIVSSGKYTIQVALQVYNLGSESFLGPNGYHYPQVLGPEPITINIR
jgi:hypothetical protein